MNDQPSRTEQAFLWLAVFLKAGDDRVSTYHWDRPHAHNRLRYSEEELQKLGVSPKEINALLDGSPELKADAIEWAKRAVMECPWRRSNGSWKRKQ